MRVDSDGRRASRPQALVLDGAPSGDEDAQRLAPVLVELLEDEGLAAGRLTLRDVPVAWCQGCFDCWVKTPGLCRTDDAGRAVAEAWLRAELAVLISPVTFGGYSSHLKKALDRLLCTVSPFFERSGGNVLHRRRYAHYPGLLAVGVVDADDGEESRIFHRLVGRNALHYRAPLHASRVLPRGLTEAEIGDWLRPVVAGVVGRLSWDAGPLDEEDAPDDDGARRSGPVLGRQGGRA